MLAGVIPFERRVIPAKPSVALEGLDVVMFEGYSTFPASFMFLLGLLRQPGFASARYPMPTMEDCCKIIFDELYT